MFRLPTVLNLVAFFVATAGGPVLGEDATVVTSTPIELTAVPLDGGWTTWEGLGDPEWNRITAMAVLDDEVWVAAYGRILFRDSNVWKQMSLKNSYITGIARSDGGVIWLSTADGIRRLKPVEDGWELKEFRTYYEGHPAFVSGIYIPGENSTRIWGYVDGIFSPKDDAYAPYVISNEHGLYSSINGVNGGWHQFLPHYWGANSPWLDLAELIPHRRPTCMAEDADGHLWIGTEWDGLVRFNAHARKYHERPAENNAKDSTEVTTFGSREIGTDFRRVTGIVPSAEGGVWVVLTTYGGESAVARFKQGNWDVWPVPEKLGPATAIAEAGDGYIYVAGNRSLLKVHWKLKDIVGRNEEMESIRHLIRLPNGTNYAASPWALYEKPAESPARPEAEPETNSE